MKLWKKCPLLVSVAVSGFIITVIALANRNGVYAEYETNGGQTPVLAVVFQGLKDGKYPWSETKEKLAPEKEEQDLQDGDDRTQVSGNSPDNQAAENVQDSETGETAEDDGEDSAAGQEESAVNPDEQTADGGNEEQNAQQEGSDAGEEEEKESQENILQETQKPDYFADAVFIGDSRTQGLLEYGGLGPDTTFYCKTSLTIYDLFKKPKAFIKENGKSITLEQALTEHQFGKVYLMIGINELGTGNTEYFYEEYARTVEKIQQLQPDSIIFIQSIMRVGSKKNASDKIFNNANINARNESIATLADGQKIFYLDVNEAVCDGNGNLYDDWTFDQVHLKAKYYQVWKEFLIDHEVELP